MIELRDVVEFVFERTFVVGGWWWWWLSGKPEVGIERSGDYFLNFYALMHALQTEPEVEYVGFSFC